jgi:hypothetical protein
MTFRLQTRNSAMNLLCMTFRRDDKKYVRYAPTLSTCNETSQFEDVPALYSVRQLFHLYPRSSRPQRITHFPYDGDICYCFTVVTGSSVTEHHHLVLTKCALNIVEEQLFLVEYLTSIGPTNLGDTDTGERGEATMRWVGLGGRYCVGVKFFSRVVGKISLHKCETNSTVPHPHLSHRGKSSGTQGTRVAIGTDQQQSTNNGDAGTLPSKLDTDKAPCCYVMVKFSEILQNTYLTKHGNAAIIIMLMNKKGPAVGMRTMFHAHRLTGSVGQLQEHTGPFWANAGPRRAGDHMAGGIILALK